MIITFPHMGDMGIILKTLFNGLGQQILLPPPITKRTLELGVKHSPETACLPFKVTLGNFIEALEQGADTLVTCGGVGPCRLGYYAEVQRGILKGLGYEFEMVIFEPKVFDALRNMRKVASNCRLWDIFKVVHLALAKIYALDAIQRKVCMIRPREVNAGEADAIRRETIAVIDVAKNNAELKSALRKAELSLDKVELKTEAAPLRIGMVGEIYVMLEPFINQNIDQRLAKMGVEVHRTMYLSDYINGHLLRKREYLQLFKRLADLARPYLGHYVGGHGLKSIAHTVSMGQENYDGIIHIFPFTCMPEVVAKNILPKVSKDVDIPVLSLAFDEQSGEAGTMTRLEAFVDLLKRRRNCLANPGRP